MQTREPKSGKPSCIQRSYALQANKETLYARYVLLATPGVRDQLPAIEGASKSGAAKSSAFLPHL
jgi:hypothetical protein